MHLSLKPLNEQVIVITGASSGIGLATAKAAAKAGAKIILSSRNDEDLSAAVAEIEAAGGTARHVVADVAKREEVEALAAAAIEAFGRFDTWVNNAGAGIFGKLEEVPETDARALFDINYWGLVNGTLAAAAHLRQSGGAIINLGSVVSDIGFPIQGVYAASKHAVMGFTDAFRMEMKAEKAPLSITLIKPTSIDTPFTTHAKNYTDGKPELPPPVYTPEDVAQAILHAAVHGGREYYVGGAGKFMSSLNKLLPGVVDWFGANFIIKQSVLDEPAPRGHEDNLHGAGADGEERGGTTHMTRRSAYTTATEHPFIAGAAIGAIGFGLAGLLSSGKRK